MHIILSTIALLFFQQKISRQNKLKSQIHHHHQLPYTDANYGNIFSLWDRIFGTYQYLPADRVVFGVDTYPDAEQNSRLKYLLALAFKPYKSPAQK